jgi:hypothetical protein
MEARGGGVAQGVAKNTHCSKIQSGHPALHRQSIEKRQFGNGESQRLCQITPEKKLLCLLETHEATTFQSKSHSNLASNDSKVSQPLVASIFISVEDF